MCRLLLANGAKKEVKTSDGERPLDLIDASDLLTIGAMLESEEARRARLDNTEDASMASLVSEISVSKKHKNKKEDSAH
jgi:ankyrin repeat protein